MARKKGFPNMGGNMNNMLKQVQKMQQEMAKAQEEAEQMEFEASVGGGILRVCMNGKKELTDVVISDDFDPEDMQMLPDLIMAAVNEVYRKAQEHMDKSMGQFTGGLNIPGL